MTNIKKKKYFIKLTPEQMKYISIYAWILYENSNQKYSFAEINNYIIESKHGFCMVCTFGFVCIYKEGDCKDTELSKYEELTLNRDEHMDKADVNYKHYFLYCISRGSVAYHKTINIETLRKKQIEQEKNAKKLIIMFSNNIGF